MGKYPPRSWLVLWRPVFRLFVVVAITTVIIIWLRSRSFDRGGILIQEPIQDDEVIYGPGEQGTAVVLPDKYNEAVRKAYQKYGFNQLVSDMISVNRSLMDYRHFLCGEQIYILPPVKVSVIIPFFEEGWSTLIRTVMSVLRRTPKHLLHEIILVDDHSSMDHLGKRLDSFCDTYNGLVKVVRHKEHVGLIKAKITGADAATGDHLVFLDSHCEASRGWLPPLLEPITNNYRVVTCPIIDGIEHSTFLYKPYGEPARGTFSWQFLYKERPLNQKQLKRRKSSIELVASPVMAGGIFAISKQWWLELGKYDPGMYGWGGEQYELSFKLWMCGGSMFNVPCSRVGHVYRGPGIQRNDQGLGLRHPHSTDVNHKRVAEVWMDEYKHFLYARRPNIEGAENFEDGIEERHQIRRSLRCKSFANYLVNVVQDTLHTAYEPDRALSTIQNEDSGECVTYPPSSGGRVTLQSCGLSSQVFRWTWINEVREEEHCWDSYHGEVIVWLWCHERQGAQHFIYKEDKTIYSDTYGKCVGYNENNELVLVPCEPNNRKNRWVVQLKDLSVAEFWAKAALNEPRNP